MRVTGIRCSKQGTKSNCERGGVDRSRVLRAKIDSDAANANCGADFGAAGGAGGARGRSARGRAAGVRDGVLPRASCECGTDEMQPCCKEWCYRVHDGMQFAASRDLRVEWRAAEDFTRARRGVAGDAGNARNLSRDDDFGFPRALPSSVQSSEGLGPNKQNEVPT